MLSQGTFVIDGLQVYRLLLQPRMPLDVVGSMCGVGGGAFDSVACALLPGLAKHGV